MKLDRTATPLDALCAQLTVLLSDPCERVEERTGAEVARLLRDYAASNQCWRPFVHHVEGRYARNLVWRCGDFELLLLTWGEGQESPIHDHAGQQCWMAVLEGELEEVHYEAPSGTPTTDLADEALEKEAMRVARVHRFPKGGVAYIHDDIALHLIRPAPGQRGVSLHLYAGAIDTCQVYDPITGEVSRTQVGYDSVRGEACGDRCPDEIRAEWAALDGEGAGTSS